MLLFLNMLYFFFKILNYNILYRVFFLVISILKYNWDECILKKCKLGWIGNIFRVRFVDIYNNDIFWYNLYKMIDISIWWLSKYYYY